MIESHEYLKFENINKLSKHIYLYWLNENKKHCALVSKSFSPNSVRYELIECCFFTPIYNMLIRNKHLVYNPLKKYL